MNCTHCEILLPAGAKFCPACGQAVVARCSACAAALIPGARFCAECGTSTGASAAAAESNSKPEAREPSAYTPKHLADKILQSRSALEGERKQVTVLFADVKGSMELAEQFDPEEWHSILERFFAILSEGVHRFEGTVNQYTGDGIMALFGAPIAHEDHSQRACYAALALREALARYATEVMREHGVAFSTRIGINSGDVVVGSIGDDLRMDYTAQGHTVGLAQRMESLALPDSCCVAPATVALAGGYFAFEDLGEFRVKGAAEPVRVHRLTGLGTARTRFDLSRARGLSRFVGRSADLRTLEDALALSTAGNGQVIGVVAEAGTGKSRLCFEFLETCRARGLQVFEARAVSHGKNVPLLPILELFRAYFGITTQDDERSTREKIAGRMMVLDRTFADTLPLVYDFLGVSDPQNPAPELGAEARQRQLLAVMRQVIKSASQTRPIITLIEDLHWLDTSSAEFLEHLVDAREGSRSLLLLNFRPEYQAEWMQKSWYRQIPLTPLGRDAIAELLADLLGTHPSTSDLVSPIHTRTGGNPFFTEEVVQSLIESGHLEGTRSAYRLVTPIERLEVPATVQAVLAARIDRLPEREKQLLQVASVIGKDFTETLLADVAGLPADELKSALAALRRAEFILELSIYPVIEYTFKHPLTQEVALHSQLQTRRRQVHADVARAIERQDADHLDERAALLAQHWDEAGEALLAARWYRRAAEWVGSTDLTAATRNWQKARLLQRQVRGNREATEIGLTACLQLLANMSFRVAADLDEARAVLAEGQALAESLGDRDEALNLSIHFSRVLGASGDVAGCVQLAFENHRAARGFADVALHINADTYLMDALHLSGRYPELLAQHQEWQDRVPRDLPRETWLRGINPYTFLKMFESVACAFVGHLPVAIEHFEQVQVLVAEDRTPEIAGFAWAMQAEMHYLAGDRAGALTSARHAIAASERMPDNLSLAGYAQLALTHACLLTGQSTQAVEAAERSLHCFQEADICYAGKAAAFLAVALLEAGDLPAAGATAEHAIELCRRSLRAVYETIAHGVRALVMIRLEGAAARERIEAELALADDLIERFGTRTLIPSLLEWRAELAAAAGHSGERHRLLATAQARYLEVGAPLQAARIAGLARAEPA